VLLVVVLSLVALATVPLVHEAGHALVALLIGGRRVTFVRRGRLSFATRADLPESAVRRRAFYAGGPLANVVVGLFLAAAARALASDPSLLVTALGAALAHLVFALVNLLPLSGHDGRALFSRAAELE
jgi:hypothetical protein